MELLQQGPEITVGVGSPCNDTAAVQEYEFYDAAAAPRVEIGLFTCGEAGRSTDHKVE